MLTKKVQNNKTNPKLPGTYIQRRRKSAEKIEIAFGGKNSPGRSCKEQPEEGDFMNNTVSNKFAAQKASGEKAASVRVSARKMAAKLAAGALAFSLTFGAASAAGIMSDEGTRLAYAEELSVPEYVFGERLELGYGDFKYSFSIEKSGRLSVQYISSYGFGTVEIRDTMGNQVVKDFEVAANTQKLSHFDLLAGDYFLCGHNSGNEMSVVAAFAESEETFNENYTEKNNEQSMATEIKPTADFTAQFAANDKSDFYTFDTTKDGVYSFTLKSEVQLMKLSLYNTDLTYSYTIDRIEGGTHKYSLAIPEGTYYLVAENEKADVTGKYKLSSSFKEVEKSSVKKLVSGSAKKLAVSVSKAKGVSGVQVQVSNKANFSSGKKTVTIEGSKASFGGLKSNSVYYVRVRSYVTSENGEKIFSAWSKAKQIKVK